MRDHGVETGVDDAAIAFADLIDGGLHVVVNATCRDAAQCSKRAVVGIEQHFVALPWIRRDKECSTGAQLGMGGGNFAQDVA